MDQSLRSKILLPILFLCLGIAVGNSCGEDTFVGPEERAHAGGPPIRYRVLSPEGRLLFIGDEIGKCGTASLLFNNLASSSIGKIPKDRSVCIPEAATLRLEVTYSWGKYAQARRS